MSVQLPVLENGSSIKRCMKRVGETLVFVFFFMIASSSMNLRAQGDDPCSSTALTLSSGTCSYTSGTNAVATVTTGPPSPGCCGSTFKDVWYNVTVPASGRIVFSTEAGTLTDAGMAIYSGTVCGTLTLIECDDDDGTGNMPMIDKSGLTVGSTIWIRVWGYNTAQGTFTICALNFVPPVNDEPCAAIQFSVSSGSCTYTSGTNASATISAGPPAPGCSGSVYEDVWYKTTVPASGCAIFSMEAGTLTDAGMAIYSGTTCSSLTLIECDDEDGTGSMPMIKRAGLTPGSTIWVRIWGYAGAEGSFTLCALEVIVPVNDETCNAIDLPLLLNTCNTVSGTTSGASPSAGIPTPGCCGTVFNEVWYKLTVPGSGSFIISSEAGTLTDAGMAVYSGTDCSSLTLISCSDDYANTYMPTLSASGLTAGSTVWVRLWGYNGAEGTFTLCAKAFPVAPSCASNPSAGDAYTSPTPICNLNGFCGNTSASYTQDEPGNLTSVFCGTIQNNSWLSFTADNDTASLNIWVSNCVDGTGIQMQILDLVGTTFTSYSNCWNPAEQVNGIIVATNLVIGHTYYLMIDGNLGDVCDYIIGASSGVSTGAEASTTTPMISCAQSVTLNGTGGSSYSWSSNPAGFTSAAQNPVVSPTITTTYTMTVTGGNPLCPTSNTDTVVVQVNPFIIDAGTDATICLGTSVALAGSGTGSYSWSSNPIGFSSTNQNPTVSPTVTTTYILSVDNGTCVGTGDVVVNVNTVLVADASASPTSICSGASTTLSGTGGTDYSWSSVPVGYTSTDQNPAVSPTITTTYTLTVSSGLCSETDAVIVTVNSAIVASASASPNTICAGASSTLNGGGGTGFSWTSDPVGYASASQNPVVSPTTTTTYTLLTISAGCSDTETVVVTVNPVPVATATATPNTLCVGASSNLTSTGGGSYSWTSNPAGFTSTLQNPTVSPTITTTYTVLVTNNGCTDAETIVVTVNQLPVATASASPTTICAGAFAALSSGGGSSYSWTSNPVGYTSISQNPTVSPTITTTYTVLVSNSGCTDSESTIVTVNPSPLATANALPNNVCSGESTSLTGGGGTTYSWTSIPAGFTSSSQNPSVSPTATTTYTVLVTNGGCTDTESTVVTLNSVANATAIATPSIICNGSSSTLNGGGGTGFSWTSSPAGFTSTAQNPIVSPTITTTYTLLVNNAGGCTGAQDVVVTVNSIPLATATAMSDTICVGEISTLSSGGGTSYSWTSTPSGFTSAAQNPDVTPTLTTTYTVVAGNGTCSDTESVIVVVNPIPVATATASPDVLCIGASTALNSTGGGTYSWTSDPIGFTSISQNPSVSPTITTTYTVLVTNNGCSDSEAKVVTVNNYPVITATSDQGTICQGSGTTLHSVGGTIYNWASAPAGYISAAQNPNVNPTITTTYVVSVDDGTGCISTNQVVVHVDDLPQLTLAPNININLCEGNSAVLAINGANEYLWNTGLTTPSITVSPTSSLTYSVTATSGVCVIDTIFNVIVNELPEVELGPDMTVCSGKIATITVQSNSNQLVWSNGYTMNQISVSDSGEYSIIATNSCGSAYDTIQVIYHPTPIINLGTDTTLCVSNFPLALPVDFAKYYWSTGEETSSIYAQVGGIYYTEATDYNGCMVTDTIVLTDSCFTDIFIPNTFTPNGDGLNDEFRVEALNLIEFEMYIFNRWGEQVYYSADVTKGWNGKYHNRICSQGTFYYIINYQGNRDYKKSVKGFLNLLR